MRMIAMPMFDVDDLSFFRALGLGLRHVNLEKGREEAQKGGIGDAVSLAAFGINFDKKFPSFYNGSLTSLGINLVEMCEHFQKEVEKFVLSSYQQWHAINNPYNDFNHYKDAAFILLDTEGMATFPYDFGSYPLGKCGRKPFTAKQVILLLSSEQYHSADENQAAFNTMVDFKNKIKPLKILKAQELLDKLNQNQSPFTIKQRNLLQCILQTMISYYHQNIYIESDIFLNIFRLLNESRLLEHADQIIFDLQETVEKVQQHVKKDNTTLFLTPCAYEIEPEDIEFPFNFEALPKPNETLFESSPKTRRFHLFPCFNSISRPGSSTENEKDSKCQIM